jgi:hypothetical protein
MKKEEASAKKDEGDIEKKEQKMQRFVDIYGNTLEVQERNLNKPRKK